MIGNFAVIFEHVSWHFAESLTPLINESDVGHYEAATAAAAFTAARWIRNVVKLSFVNLSIFRLLSIFLMSIHSFNMLYCTIHCTVSYHVKQIKFAHSLRIEPNPPECKVTVLCVIAGERERESKKVRTNKSLERDSKWMVYFLLGHHFPFNVVHLVLRLLQYTTTIVAAAATAVSAFSFSCTFPMCVCNWICVHYLNGNFYPSPKMIYNIANEWHGHEHEMKTEHSTWNFVRCKKYISIYLSICSISGDWKQ